MKKSARAIAVTIVFAIGCGRSGLFAGRTDGAEDAGAGSATDTASGPPPKPTAVFAGINRTCAVAGDQVYCWFSDCSAGAKIPKNTVPVRIEGLPSGIDAVALGGQSCALVDGRVLCASNDVWGLSGNGTKGGSDRVVQVQGLDTGVTAIAAGYSHVCVVADGGLRCWGRVQYSSEFRTVPFDVVAPGSGVQAVSAGHWVTCQVMKGRAYCWGGNGNEWSTPLPVAGLDMEVMAIATGSEESCALGAGGVKCWIDSGREGEDEHATWGTSLFTVQGDMSSASAIAMGDSYGCVLIGGGVQCWQVKWVDGLVVGTVPKPIQGLTSQVVGLAAGAMHTCALIQDEIQCWCDGLEAAPELLTVQFP